MTRPKHLSVRDALAEKASADRDLCASCSAPAEGDGPHCTTCASYWRDVDAGLWDRTEAWGRAAMTPCPACAEHLETIRGPFVAVDGQSFSSEQDWVNRATRALTSHPQYRNTEHDGPATGWRGPHFTALCFDQRGRRVRNGGDFKRATEDNAYPVWWVWPDQIAGLLLGARLHPPAEAGE